MKTYPKNSDYPIFCFLFKVFIVYLSIGDGRYWITASSNGWTPLFLNELPKKTGVIFSRVLSEFNNLLIACLKVEEQTYYSFKYF